jgi:hypothetical protein
MEADFIDDHLDLNDSSSRFSASRFGTSLASVINTYEFKNGRRYSAFREGRSTDFQGEHEARRDIFRSQEGNTIKRRRSAAIGSVNWS